MKKNQRIARTGFTELFVSTYKIINQYITKTSHKYEVPMTCESYSSGLFGTDYLI